MSRTMELHAQLVLNRPLMGIPIVPDEMYNKLGIYPVAWEDTSKTSGCMRTQLVLAVRERKNHDNRIRVRKTVTGKKITVEPDDEDHTDVPEVYQTSDREMEEEVEEEASSSAGPARKQIMTNERKYNNTFELAHIVDEHFNKRYPAVEFVGDMTLGRGVVAPPQASQQGGYDSSRTLRYV